MEKLIELLQTPGIEAYHQLVEWNLFCATLWMGVGIGMIILSAVVTALVLWKQGNIDSDKVFAVILLCAMLVLLLGIPLTIDRALERKKLQEYPKAWLVDRITKQIGK